MSLASPPAARALVLAALIALFSLAAFAQSAGAASKVKRAERAVKLAAVHKYGVGTKVNVRCASYKGGVMGCALAASPRATKAVYLTRAQVNRRLRVRFVGKTVCVGAGCKN